MIENQNDNNLIIKKEYISYKNKTYISFEILEKKFDFLTINELKKIIKNQNIDYFKFGSKKFVLYDEFENKMIAEIENILMKQKLRKLKFKESKNKNFNNLIEE